MANSQTTNWKPVEDAPYDTKLLVWLFLPKNPPASGCSIGSRVFVEEGRGHGDEGQGVYEHDAWWVGGRYYSPGHVTHWMELPDAP